MATNDIDVFKRNLDDIENLLFQIGDLNLSEALGKIYNCLHSIYSIIEPEASEQ